MPPEGDAGPSGGPSPPSGREADGPSDRELGARVRRGDREAFGRLVRRYLRPVHAVIASYLAEPADVEDAVQEAFLRALDGIGGYDPDRPFAPWLYQIARNVARSELEARDRRADGPLPEGGLPSGAGGPGARLERAEIRRKVDAAARRLPDRQRSVFRLMDVEGYDAAEVAEMTGLASGTVRSHLHHARRKLRQELAPLLERREEP